MKMHLTSVVLILLTSVVAAENEVRCGHQASKYLIVSLTNEDKVNSFAQFHCSRNSTLIGSVTSTCEPSGVWSNPWPVCEIRCLVDKLAFPGLLRGPKSSFRDGEVFEFKCDPRYKEANIKKFKCEDGNWMGPIPPCIAGSCTKPIPTVENAKAEVLSRTHLSVVKYVCEKPYVLVETSQVQCLFSEWEGHPPKCEIGKCFLKDLEHSEKVSPQTANVTLSGNELDVRCEVGYHPIPEKPLCVNGKWTRNFKPLCKISSCFKSPPVVEHAKAIIESTSHTSVLKYECQDPYILVGNSQIRCLYGDWRGQHPKCEDSRCYLRDLGRSDGMSVVTNFVTNTGEELNVICNPGYDVNPVKPLCSNGKWTKNSAPPCIEKAAATCDENPPPINHGRTIVSSRIHGSLVEYVCDDSYLQVGKSQVQCIRGVWRGFLPRCIDTRCYLKDLQRADNIAPVTPNITLSGDHLNVTCEEGYTTRPVIPICLDGKWNRNFISPCKEMTCNKPPPKVINGVEEVIYRPVRTIVKYRCKEPYILEGPSQIECLFGEWRGQLPKCTAKNCADAPPNVIHAVVEVRSTPQNKLAKYVCKEPYLLVGNSEIRCLFGEWNGTLPMCKDSRCYLYDLQTGENLAEGTPIATNSGEKLNATCKVGYTLDEERPVCQNGTWIKNSFSICKESTCSIPNVDHGDVLEEYKGEFYFNLTKLQYDRNILHIKMPIGRTVSPGTSYMLLCHKGHVVQGKSVHKSDISCIAGKWLPEPVCVFDKTKVTTPGKANTEDDNIHDTTPVAPTTQPTAVVPEVTSKCSCKYLPKDENLIATVDGKLLKQYHGVRKGAEVVFRCLHVGFHRFDGLQELQCQNCKEWNVTELPRCIEPEAGNTIILFDRNVNVSDEGHLEIMKGQPLELICVGVESVMYPNWNVPNPDGVTIKRRRIEQNSEKIQYVSELKINSVNIEDEGSYDCAVEDNPDTTVQLFVIDPDVRCPEFPENEQVEVTYKNERQVRSKAFFSCKEKSAELIGKSAVRCLKNGEWSGPAPKCYEIKCRKLKEANLLSIYYTDDRKIGSFATFHCSGPGKRLGEPFARCLENGLWSKKVPTCQRANDFKPPSSGKNETIIKPTITSTPTENGQECFCTYNYQTRLLAATVGSRRLEASSRVGRGDVVSFACLYHNMHLKWQNGLRLLGPVNLTCECENFKEQDLPTCEIRKSGINVVLYDNKMKFLPGGVIRIPRGENIKIQCVNSKAPPQWNTFGRDGIITSSELSRPTTESKDVFVSSIAISDADDEHSGRYECLGPYGPATPLDLTIYDDEEASPATEPTLPYDLTPEPTVATPTLENPESCSHCTYDYSSDLMLIATVRSTKIQPGEPIKEGEVISLNCRYPGMVIQWKNGVEFSGEVNLTCKGCEKWNTGELPTCEVERAGGSFIVYNDKMNILPGGIIEITRGDSFEFRCINHWVQPIWEAGNRAGIYFENDKLLSSRKAGYFSTYMVIDEVDDEHAGTYRCFATDPIRVYEGTEMNVKISNLGASTPMITQSITTSSTARPIGSTPVTVATEPPDLAGKCYCTYNYEPRLLIASAKKRIEVGGRVAKDTIVSFSCLDPEMKLQWPNGMKFSGNVNLRCDACEKWKRSELPTCDFVDEEDSLLFYDDTMKILPNGIIEVPKGDSFQIRCFNPRVPPQWSASDKEGVHFAKTSLLISYMVIDEVTEAHAGEYHCSSNEFESATLHLQVSDSGAPTPTNAVTSSTARPTSFTPVTVATEPPDLPGKCYCTYNYDPRLLIASAKKHLEVGGRVAKDTIVSFSCQDPDMKLQWPNGMKFSGKVNLRCDACEKWKRSELPTCDFVEEEDCLLIYDDKMRILPNGKIEVPKGDSIEIRCVNSQVQPQWSSSDRGGIYFSSDSNDVRRKTGLYSSYMLIDEVTEEHAGVYQCSSNAFGSVTLDLQVASDDSDLQCPELPLITDKGVFVIIYESDRKIHSVAQYQCEDDTHLLIGNESRVCMENGQWSGTSPKCEAPEIECPKLPSTTKRGTFIITYENNRKIRSTAYYSCQDKTKKLIGGRRRTCLENGEWSGREPSCEDLTCPDLPLRNGMLAFYTNGNKIRSTVKFRCPQGTTIVGSTSSVCQADGTWSSAWPTCEDYISCERFDNPLGLEVTYSDNGRVESRATFRCLPPHDLVGSSFAICSDELIWSKPLPLCKGIPVCRLSRELSPRLIIDPKRDYYRFGDFALLSCPPGMSFTTKIERVMCHGEKWSHEFPDCLKDTK